MRPKIVQQLHDVLRRSGVKVGARDEDDKLLSSGSSAHVVAMRDARLPGKQRRSTAFADYCGKNVFPPCICSQRLRTGWVQQVHGNGRPSPPFPSSVPIRSAMVVCDPVSQTTNPPRLDYISRLQTLFPQNLLYPGRTGTSRRESTHSNRTISTLEQEVSEVLKETGAKTSRHAQPSSARPGLSKHRITSILRNTYNQVRDRHA